LTVKSVPARVQGIPRARAAFRGAPSSRMAQRAEERATLRWDSPRLRPVNEVFHDSSAHLPSGIRSVSARIPTRRAPPSYATTARYAR
jgi:hypothetical protein